HKSRKAAIRFVSSPNLSVVEVEGRGAGPTSLESVPSSPNQHAEHKAPSLTLPTRRPSSSGDQPQEANNVTEPTYTLEDLQPFTLYKFRIWAVISETYIVSPESQFYRTEPSGVGMFTYYSTVCLSRISIAAVNREGQGVAAEASVTTPPSPGIAVLRDSDLVYFSEGTRIWEKGAGNLTDNSDLRLVHSSDSKVTALTVDWLSRKLYYVSDAKVWYCKLDDCSHPADFNLILNSTPTRIIADPYNGLISSFLFCAETWLFLLLHDGIYRISLPELPDRADDLTLVVKTDDVRDFVVSFPDRRLVFYDKGKRVLSTVTLGGLLPVSLYVEIKHDVQSVAYGDGLLVLTDGRAVYKQTGNGQVAIFTEFPMDCDVLESDYGGFGNIHFFGRGSQPYPVPRKPTDLQVVFGSNKASLRWNKPDIQNGSKDDAPYIAGAAAAEGIWRQQLDSFDFLDMLTPSVKDVKDMDWYNNTIFWTNSSGHISWTDASDGASAPEGFLVPQNMEAHAIAFDWLGQSLYWSCNTNMICRGRLSGQGAEIFLKANQKIESIILDALNASIYWSTETTLEVCRLDGEGRDLLEKLSVLSGAK
ncbi:Proto-oncogene tyrosine-protein kinase ROS, partial [Clarias magur]